ncbi:8684_t:CDS:10, partial [Ambispora leptoticha]
MATLSGYLAILAVDIANDNPVIKQTISLVDFLPAPDFLFLMSYDFKLTCSAYFSDSTSSNCTNAITYDYNSGYYYAKFTNDGSFKMSPPSTTTKMIEGLNFIFVIKDPKFNASNPDSLVIMANDAEGINSETLANSGSNYQSSIYGMNSFIIGYDVNANLAYTRSIKEIIQPSPWTNFGIPPHYSSEPYINADVRVKSLLVTVETEQRSKTVLSSFALFGGAWGLAAGVYTLFFGHDTQRPWGCAQTCCCIFSKKAKSHFRNTFPVIPLAGNAKLASPESNLIPQSQDPAVQHLQQRLDALELFLRD